MFIWSSGYFTVVHFPEEDVTVLWDRKTTIHIQVGPRWQVRHCLCFQWNSLSETLLKKRKEFIFMCSENISPEKCCALCCHVWPEVVLQQQCRDGRVNLKEALLMRAGEA